MPTTVFLNVGEAYLQYPDVYKMLFLTGSEEVRSADGFSLLPAL
ncbi:hypothetical protein QE390_003679 [Siphonobacter sp. SORGH_AS 1065]|nr:hypothetical protein [Siphonobacter sp. SORGH_AS_1065]